MSKPIRRKPVERSPRDAKQSSTSAKRSSANAKQSSTEGPKRGRQRPRSLVAGRSGPHPRFRKGTRKQTKPASAKPAAAKPRAASRRHVRREYEPVVRVFGRRITPLPEPRT